MVKVMKIVPWDFNKWKINYFQTETSSFTWFLFHSVIFWYSHSKNSHDYPSKMRAISKLASSVFALGLWSTTEPAQKLTADWWQKSDCSVSATNLSDYVN